MTNCLTKMRRTKMTTQPGELNKNGEPSKNLDEELIAILRYLRLGRLLSHWDETLARARKGRYSVERLLKYVLEEEYRAKPTHAAMRKCLSRAVDQHCW
jgi:hypothetical protein